MLAYVGGLGGGGGRDKSDPKNACMVRTGIGGDKACVRKQRSTFNIFGAGFESGVGVAEGRFVAEPFRRLVPLCAGRCLFGLDAFGNGKVSSSAIV